MTKPEFIEQFVIAHYDDHDGSGMTDKSLAELIQRAGKVYDTIHFEPSPDVVKVIKNVAFEQMRKAVGLHTPLRN